MLFRDEMSKHIFKSVCGDRKELCDGIASLRASDGDFITPSEKNAPALTDLKKQSSIALTLTNKERSNDNER